MAESFLLGRNAKAYFHTDAALIGDLGLPTDPLATLVDAWLDDVANVDVADNLTDVGLNVGSEFADGTTRATAQSGFASQIPVLKNGEVTFEMRWIPQQADTPSASGPWEFTSLLFNAWQNDSRIAIVFFDREYRISELTTGTYYPQGLASNWSVSLEKSENLRDVQRLSVTLTVADSALWHNKKVTVP